MSRPVKAILLFSLVAAPGFAAALLFQGTFAADDHQLFNFRGNTPQAITIQTDSSAGGTVNPAVIRAGGLAPTAPHFGNLGRVPTPANGSCRVGLDATTGSCGDLDFRDALGPGTFTLALAGGPSLTRRLTPQEAGTSGSFCDLTTALGTTALGTTRMGNYAIAITGADSVLGPEPGSMFLPVAGAVTALQSGGATVSAHDKFDKG
jgi:hypothetical protein